MDKEDKQNIRAEEYEEKISYAPGWPPQPTAAPAVDPHLEVTLDVKVTSEQYVFVLMSLTSAFCPAADSMPREIQQKIESSMPGFKCKVRITMLPQWGREMIQPDIRSLMGL